MANRPTRPKGYYPKRKPSVSAKLRNEFTPKKVGSIVVNAVLDSPGGRAAKGAKVSSKVMLAARREMRKKAAGVGQRKAVSAVAARKIAEKSKFAPAGIQRGGKAKAGLRPMRTETGSKSTGASQMTARPNKQKVKSEVTKSYQSVRRTPTDVMAERTKAKVARMEAMKERPARKGTGKSIQGPKTNPRTVTVAKPSPARDRAKLVNPKDRKLDASRRMAMRDAAEDKRNVFQPKNKTPYARELEQRPDSSELRSRMAGPKDKQMEEAKRRVDEGMRKINRAKRRNQKVLSPERPMVKRRTLDNALQAKRAMGVNRITGPAKLNARHRAAGARITPEQRAKIRAEAQAIRKKATGGN